MMLQPLCLFFELQEPRNSESLYPLFRPAGSLTPGLVRWSLVTWDARGRGLQCPPLSPVPRGGTLSAPVHGIDFAVSRVRPPPRWRELS